MTTRVFSCALIVTALVGCTTSRSKDSGCPGADRLGSGPAARIAQRLGRPSRLLVGLGNDLPDPEADALAWSLRHAPDIHYLYLVGLGGRGGWPDWNENGGFIDKHTADAAERCSVPAFTLYAMAVDGEGDPTTITNRAYMRSWWEGYELLLERLAIYGGPVLLHIEPDFWGFMQKNAGGQPAQIPASVSSHPSACQTLPDTLAGFGACITSRAREVAPEVVLGFHASVWAHENPKQVARFLREAGADQTDVLFVETLDRDAGCFEAEGPDCDRTDGPWYWATDATSSPNFEEHFAAMGTLHTETGLPLVWWQTPMGVPSDTPGGSEGAYRDNRVAYFFDHPEKLVEAGGLAMLFGPGWTGQTDLRTDEGQFVARWEDYREAPIVLP